LILSKPLERQQTLEAVFAVVQPMRNYYVSHFETRNAYYELPTLGVNLKLREVARWFNPSFVRNSEMLQPATYANVATLHASMPFMTDVDEANMVREQLDYELLAAQVPVPPNEYFNPASVTNRLIKTHGVFMWRHAQRKNKRIQTWVKVYKKLALILPQSAPCERVFSVYEHTNQDDSQQELVDIVEYRVLNRYNNRHDRPGGIVMP